MSILAYCPLCGNPLSIGQCSSIKCDYGSLKGALRRAHEALINVPMVGDEYDQQHSDTHTRAALEIEDALNIGVLLPRPQTNT